MKLVFSMSAKVLQELVTVFKEIIMEEGLWIAFAFRTLSTYMYMYSYSLTFKLESHKDGRHSVLMSKEVAVKVIESMHALREIRGLPPCHAKLP